MAMQNSNDEKITDILAKYGEPLVGNIWRVQGQAVIYHKALERIAARAQIHFDRPTIVRAEADEAVILVMGHMDERTEWSFGEAKLNANYRISGRQAPYLWSMAEKRGKDRVVLKLIELHGDVYSEEEIDRGEATGTTEDAPAEEAPPWETAADPTPAPKVTPSGPFWHPLMGMIDKCKTINATTDFMLAADTQKTLNDLPPQQRDEIRAYAKTRLRQLGWPEKKGA
jgi:hypothetical protein